MDYIVDTIAVHIQLDFHERQLLLETASLKERLLKLCGYIKKEIDILQTEQRIKGRIQTQVEKSQREYYLTEQMKAIQKELGREDQAAEITQIRAKIKKLSLPEEAQEKVEKELRRLEQMPPLSPEAVVSRNYIDWIISLPWNKMSKDTISLTQAEKILNQNHAGLPKQKNALLNFWRQKNSQNLSSAPLLYALLGLQVLVKRLLAIQLLKHWAENLFVFLWAASKMKQKFVAIAVPISVHCRVKLFKQ